MEVLSEAQAEFQSRATLSTGLCGTLSTFSKNRQFFFPLHISEFTWICESHLLSMDRFVDQSSTLDNKQNYFGIEDDEHRCD